MEVFDIGIFRFTVDKKSEPISVMISKWDRIKLQYKFVYEGPLKEAILRFMHEYAPFTAAKEYERTRVRW